jgi:hypothetical protein
MRTVDVHLRIDTPDSDLEAVTMLFAIRKCLHQQALRLKGEVHTADRLLFCCKVH